MRRLLLVCAVIAAVLIPGSPAWAHAQLLSSDPAKDATLTEAPAAVALKFSERLNPDFTTIVISDAVFRLGAVVNPISPNARAHELDRDKGHKTWNSTGRYVTIVDMCVV